MIEEEHGIVKTLADPTFPLSREETSFFFHDLDSTFSRAVEGLDQLREGLTSLFDLQLSLKSDHMNVIMKTLTVVSALFLPLSFLSGLYGMNFEYIPELKWRYGYFALLAVMTVLAILLMAFFKKRRWW